MLQIAAFLQYARVVAGRLLLKSMPKFPSTILIAMTWISSLTVSSSTHPNNRALQCLLCAWLQHRGISNLIKLTTLNDSLIRNIKLLYDNAKKKNIAGKWSEEAQTTVQS